MKKPSNLDIQWQLEFVAGNDSSDLQGKQVDAVYLVGKGCCSCNGTGENGC